MTYFWDGSGDTRVTVHVSGPAEANLTVQLPGEESQSATIDVPVGAADEEHGFATDRQPSAVLAAVTKGGRIIDCAVIRG